MKRVAFKSISRICEVGERSRGLKRSVRSAIGIYEELRCPRSYLTDLDPNSMLVYPGTKLGSMPCEYLATVKRSYIPECLF